MAKSGEKKKRYDRATNELIILEFINKYVKKNEVYPSLEAIKKGVGNYMSNRTVDRIISDIDLLAACKNHPSKLKLNEFLNSMCQHGLDGNIPAGKLWLALIFGWNEKKMYEILNNFKTGDKYDYSSLTAEELRTLEAILSKAKKVTDNSIQLIVSRDFLPDTSSIDNR
jgi:hypothetical protein